MRIGRSLSSCWHPFNLKSKEEGAIIDLDGSGRLSLMPTRFRVSDFSVAEEDWAVLTTAQPNVLLVGPEPLTSEFVEALRPTFRQPVSYWRASSQHAPASRPGTLILHDADRLTLEDQRQLDNWLAEASPMQVVTIASTPLYPFVEGGQFLASLYYRLNVVYLTFGASESVQGS
jgi:hypothetical protein